MTPERDSKSKTIYYQIGIVSYGIGCALEEVPGIYTSVQYFADWIKKQVQGWLISLFFTDYRKSSIKTLK